MDSPVGNALKNVAGYGVGTLAALTTIKGGGLGPYLMNRQRLMSDPGFRASLAGSPFAAGVFGVSGETGPAPAAPSLPAAAGGGVAQPSDFVGPPAPGQVVAPPAQAAPGQLPAPTAFNVPGYMPGGGRAWMPSLPAYDPKAALEQRGLATAELGLGSQDAGMRGQYKMAAGIPLDDQEMREVVKRGAEMQALGGPGTVVKLDIPGMTTNVGSPYNLSAVTSEEYPTPALAQAAAAARNANIPPGNPQWTVVPSGRGTFLLAPPATGAQTLPATPPAPEFRSPGATSTTQTPTTGGPPATIATRTNNPGNIKDGPFARAQPGYIGSGPTAADGGQFAVFDSPASGFAAQGALLSGPAYRNLSVHDAMRKWSNGGYGGDIVAPLGIDPTRTVGSLTPEELAGVTRQQAQREGYQFGGAAPAAPSPAPSPALQTAQAPPPPQPAAPTPAVTAPRPAAPASRPAPRPAAPTPPATPWDPNEVVPHVIVPAPRAAYPSAAFGGETPPSVPMTPTTAPPPTLPPTTPPPPMPPGRTAVDPTTGLPLSGRTVESQAGSETFTAPNLGDVGTQLRLNRAGITDPKLATPPQIANYFAQERAWTNQQKADAADIERLRGRLSEGDAEGLRELMDLRRSIAVFDGTYKTPEQRAQFVGPGTWIKQDFWERLGMQPRAVADFRTALAPFSYETLTEKDSPLKGDLAALRSSAPSGSDSPAQFESKLQAFRDRVDAKIHQYLAFQGVPASEITADRFNQAMEDAQAAVFAQRLKAFDQPPAAAPTPAAPSPPPASPHPAPGTASAGPPPPTPPPPPPSEPWQPNWVQ